MKKIKQLGTREYLLNEYKKWLRSKERIDFSLHKKVGESLSTSPYQPDEGEELPEMRTIPHSDSVNLLL